MSKADRVLRTEIGGYNQVIALTQVMINEGLKNLWEKTGFQKDQEVVKGPDGKPILDKQGKTIRGFSYQSTPDDFMKRLIFGPPSVILEPSATDLSSIRYVLHIKEGIVRALWDWDRNASGEEDADGFPTEPTKYYAQYVIKDWEVTVPVKLALRPLSPGDKGYNEAKALTEESLGNHSLYQFLVDTSKIGWKDVQCDTGCWQEGDSLVDQRGVKCTREAKVVGQKRNWREEAAPFKDAFEKMIQRGFQEMWLSGMAHLGTVAKTDEPSQKPSLHVNSVRHQTYPYCNPESGKFAPHNIPGGDLNYFLYLETLDPNFAPDPTTAGAVVKHSNGNWTEGKNYHTSTEKSKFGTYHLASSCFLEGYVLPKLTQFNRIMHLDIQEKKGIADAKFLHWYAKIIYKLQLGHGWGNDDNSSKYNWTKGMPKIEDKWENQEYYSKFKQCPQGALVWHCIDNEYNEEPHHDVEGSVDTYVWAKTVTVQRVVVEPGKDTFYMEGVTWTKLNYKIDPSRLLANKYGGFTCVADWKVTFQLRSVQDGGIAIDVSFDKPAVKFPWQAEDKWGLPNLKKKLETSYGKVGKNFEYLVNGLRDKLKGQERMILPSTGVFIFKNPLMNFKGDLVTEIEYKAEAFERNGKIKTSLNENAKIERPKVDEGKPEKIEPIGGSITKESADDEDEV